MAGRSAGSGLCWLRSSLLVVLLAGRSAGSVNWLSCCSVKECRPSLCGLFCICVGTEFVNLTFLLVLLQAMEL